MSRTKKRITKASKKIKKAAASKKAKDDKTSTWGGVRVPGPGKRLGPPTIDPDLKKQPLSTKLAPDVLDYLRQSDDGIAPTIEEAVRQTSGFKTFFKSNYEWVDEG